MAIQHLQPYHLRLLSKVEDRLNILPEGYDEEEDKPEEKDETDQKE